MPRFLAQASSARHPGRCDVAAAKRHDDPPEMVRQLIIVAGNRAHLYEHLKREFAGNGTVRVLRDRRVIARRARSGPYEAERRQAERRLLDGSEDRPQPSGRSVSMTGSPVIGPAPISGLACADSRYGNRDYAAKARSWKAISKRLA